MDASLDLEAFDVNSINTNSRIVVVGKTASGKSTKIEWIMRSLGRRIRKGFVMTGSFTNGDYAWVPPLYKHDGYDENTIRNVCYVQECKVVEQRLDPTIDPDIWFILDDLSDDDKVMTNKYLKQLFSKGRHRRITTIVMCQYFRDLRKGLRPNIDYLILLANKSPDDRKGIYNQYISCVTFPVFNRIFDKCTENYGALVFKNNANGNEANDCFSYMRIPDSEFEPDPHNPGKFRLPPFEIGCEKYRDYSRRHYRDIGKEKMEAVAAAKIRKKQRLHRKKERLRKLAIGEGDARIVSTIGSDEKSSMLTSNSELHSEPVQVGEVQFFGGGSKHHTRELDEFSIHEGDDGNGGGDGGSNIWNTASARSF